MQNPSQSLFLILAWKLEERLPKLKGHPHHTLRNVSAKPTNPTVRHRRHHDKHASTKSGPVISTKNTIDTRITSRRMAKATRLRATAPRSLLPRPPPAVTATFPTSGDPSSHGAEISVANSALASASAILFANVQQRRAGKTEVARTMVGTREAQSVRQTVIAYRERTHKITRTSSDLLSLPPACV